MIRSAIIFLETVLGGFVIYVGIVNLPGFVPKESGKSIAFASSFIAAAEVSTLATRRMAGSSELARHFLRA